MLFAYLCHYHRSTFTYLVVRMRIHPFSLPTSVVVLLQHRVGGGDSGEKVRERDAEIFGCQKGLTPHGVLRC